MGILNLAIFCFGCIIGSFLNVCIFRIPKEESIAYPPSHCGNCGHELKATDLFPVLSWVFLRGKCRYCKSKVSMQYPLIEATTGLLFVLLYIKFGWTLDLIKFMVFTALFIVIGMIDFKTQDIYDSTVIFGAIFGIGFIVLDYIFGKDVELLSVLLGIVIPALIIAIFAKFGAMGWGDVEIIALAGLFLNFKINMLNLFISIVIGGLAACILLIMKKRGGRDTMAFGPYIALSSYITAICGNSILLWYFSFIK